MYNPSLGLGPLEYVQKLPVETRKALKISKA
jgi:hypothetical protein